jgi:hypothetical protein
MWIFLVGCCLIAMSVCLPAQKSRLGLPDPEELWDLEVRSTALQLRSAEQRYLQQLSSSSGALRPHLRAARAQLRSLEHQVAILLHRADAISRFFSQSRSRMQILEDVRQLEARLIKTSDAAARGEYELALASRQRQLASV